MKNNNGFSLIELMIVVAIIGILSAIAIPSYKEYMTESRRSDAKVGLSKIADKQERYYLQNNTYTTDLAAIATNATSDGGFYIFDVVSANVSGFEVTATAIGDQASDTDCKTLSLTSTGLKSATGDDPTSCW